MTRRASGAHRLHRLSGWQSGETGLQSRRRRFQVAPCCSVHCHWKPPLLAVAAVRLYAAAACCGALLRAAEGAQQLRCPLLLTAAQPVGQLGLHVCTASVPPQLRAAAGWSHCQELLSAAVAAGRHLGARQLWRVAAGAAASSRSVRLPAVVLDRLAGPAVLPPSHCWPQTVGHGLRRMEHDSDRGLSFGRPGNAVWPDCRGRHTAC